MKNSNTVEWYYSGKADLTIGEMKLPKTAKIILIIILYLIIIFGGLGIYFNDYVYDCLLNPGIVFPATSVDLEVHNDFLPEEYIIRETDRVNVLYPKFETINTKKLGTYKAVYKTKNSIKENSHTLIVNVVDTTPPIVELVSNILVVKKTDDNSDFDALDYLKSYSDNYNKKEELKLEYTKTINFNLESTEILYSVTDKSGNETVVKLPVVIQDDSVKEVIKEVEVVKEVEKPIVKPSPTPKPQTNTSQTNNTQNSQTNTQINNETTKSKAFISGTHNVTVKVGTSYGELESMLVSGVNGSSEIMCEYSNVNLSAAGSYPVLFASEDGAQAQVTVYVVE